MAPKPRVAGARLKAAKQVLRELSRFGAKAGKPSYKKMLFFKRQASEAFKLPDIISNAELIEALPRNAPKFLRAVLRTRAVRSISGVAVIAIMTKPAKCPHGKCAYCPGGPAKKSRKGGSPQSYTGKEPAAMRAAQNKYDAFAQVQSRLEQLRAIGHAPQKCELVIMGGTFNAQPRAYQEKFIKGAFDAFNCRKSASLRGAMKANERAAQRVIGLTFETRPDWATPQRVSRIVDFGATRVELGVQTLSNSIYRKVERGHTVEQVAEATKACKDAFLKVGYHWMPGLLCKGAEDVKMFGKLFSDSRFRPDMLKIYPCLVMPGTKMHKWWKQGKFEPYDAEEAARVIARMKRLVPPYCRIMRVERDIPVPLIAAGVKNSNLRQLAQQQMAKHGWACKCIRCREVGFRQAQGKEIDWELVALKRIDYEASGGKEVFLSFEDKKADALVGFLRLRLPAEPFRKEITADAAGVRELHVYGEQMQIGKHLKRAAQHKNFGGRLLEEAERIAEEEWGCSKLLVISGVGAREYYRKQGYANDGAYVSKRF